MERIKCKICLKCCVGKYYSKGTNSYIYKICVCPVCGKKYKQKIKIFSNKNEYSFISLNKRTIALHKIVWETYNNKKIEKGDVVHHKDGHRGNNRPSNLLIMKKNKHTRDAHNIYFIKKIERLKKENKCLRLKLKKF